jgi:hypothetical protein
LYFFFVRGPKKGLQHTWIERSTFDSAASSTGLPCLNSIHAAIKLTTLLQLQHAYPLTTVGPILFQDFFSFLQVFEVFKATGIWQNLKNILNERVKVT